MVNLFYALRECFIIWRKFKLNYPDEITNTLSMTSEILPRIWVQILVADVVGRPLKLPNIYYRNVKMWILGEGWFSMVECRRSCNLGVKTSYNYLGKHNNIQCGKSANREIQTKSDVRLLFLLKLSSFRCTLLSFDAILFFWTSKKYFNYWMRYTCIKWRLISVK